MHLYVIRTVSISPTLYAIRVSKSPNDWLASLRKNAPFQIELVAQQAIDQRHGVTMRRAVYHVLTGLGLHQQNDWFSGDGELAAFLNQSRLDQWFSSTLEIAALASGFVLPKPPRDVPQPTHRCELRTAKGTQCRRRTLTPCAMCSRMCCGPHQIGMGPDEAYCRPCWRDQQRIWDLEDREKAKTKARDAFAEQYSTFELDHGGDEW